MDQVSRESILPRPIAVLPTVSLSVVEFDSQARLLARRGQQGLGFVQIPFEPVAAALSRAEAGITLISKRLG